MDRYNYTHGGFFNGTYYDDYNTSSNGDEVTDGTKRLRQIDLVMSILAILAHVALLGVIIVKVVRHVMRKEISEAQWPRYHVLGVLCIANIWCLLFIRILNVYQWNVESEGKCIFVRTAYYVGPVISCVYFYILGLLTLFQVFRPTALLGKKQFIFWTMVHPIVWISCFIIVAIEVHIDVRWYIFEGRGLCFVNGILIFISSIIVTAILLFILLLYAFVSVAGVCSKKQSMVLSSIAGENERLEWVVKTRTRAVIFVIILAISSVTVIIFNGIFNFLRIVYQAFDVNVDSLIFELALVWHHMQSVFYILFPLLCLVLEEIGTCSYWRRCPNHTSPHASGAETNATIDNRDTRESALQPLTNKSDKAAYV